MVSRSAVAAAAPDALDADALPAPALADNAEDDVCPHPAIARAVAAASAATTILPNVAPIMNPLAFILQITRFHSFSALRDHER